MDTRAQYRNIVKDVLSNYARLRPSHGQIRLDTVFDEQQDHYAVMQVGWDRGARVRGNLIYITLDNDTVQIEYDGIERGILAEWSNEAFHESESTWRSFQPAKQRLLPHSTGAIIRRRASAKSVLQVGGRNSSCIPGMGQTFVSQTQKVLTHSRNAGAPPT
jgi:hypothetical protein